MGQGPMTRLIRIMMVGILLFFAAAQPASAQELLRDSETELLFKQVSTPLIAAAGLDPKSVKVVLLRDDSINAFALPGGPMYVHTGLLKAADGEGEVAGVLAHEMSHVALRHGAAQMSKQQTYGTLFGLIGAAAGAVTSKGGECGMLCQITEAGTGLGQNSVLMKFSRGYERDADLNGARMMNAAGYDPMQLPKFFEKLETTLGTAAEPKGLALWMSSHPATGSRVQYVSDDIKYYPKRSYTASTGDFSRVKQLVAVIPAPKPQPGTLILAKKGATPRSSLPAGFKDYVANGFSIGYPDTWQAGQSQPGSSIYMIPQGGAVKTKDGGAELLLGAMIDYYVPQAGAASVNLETSTGEFVDSLKKGDPNLQTERSERLQVGGKPAVMTKLKTKTSLQQEPEQIVYLYTVGRDAGLWYLVMVAQPSKLGEFDPVFRLMTTTVLFSN